MAAVHVVRHPSASEDEQRCGGMALQAERQGEPWPAESLPADSAAARRVSAGRRQRQDSGCCRNVARRVYRRTRTASCIPDSTGCGTNTAPAAAMWHCSMHALVPPSACRHELTVRFNVV